jgi:hypothetical protein
VAASSVIPGAVVRDGDDVIYRLHVMPQAVANPDFLDVEVAVPAGWSASGETRYVGDMHGDVTLQVRLSRTVRGSIVGKLFVEPYRFLKRAFGRVF